MQRRYSESDSAMVREELGKYQSTQPCATCNGARLNAAARNVFVQERALPEIASLSVVAALEFFGALSLKGWRGEIAEKIVNEIRGPVLKFLIGVGLDDLMLDRRADTLSGGETQRLRLAGQIGSGLTGALYVLDEPTTACTSATPSACSTVLDRPRPRQHGARRRARRRHNPGRRSPRRSRPLRRRHGAVSSRGPPAEISRTPRRSTAKRSRRRAIRPAARRTTPGIESSARAATTCRRSTVHPARPHDRRRRRLGLRQAHARPATAVSGRGAARSGPETPAPHDA